MKMKFLLVISTLSFLAASILGAEPEMRRVRCSTVDYVNNLKVANPGYEDIRMSDERLLQQLLQNQAQARSMNTVYTIPVVVHVVYKTTAQNISDAQIMSQIDVLNEDFARLNPDTIQTPSGWTSIAGTSPFQFCLAQQDPFGNPTNGIERRATTLNSFSSNSNMKYYSTGGLDAWDVNRYFNIWVCNLGNFLLGYAEPPSSVHSDEYGVVISYDCFGRVGTLDPTYNQGRTTTHEIGHAMSLSHIWGDDSNCTADDGITDTPRQEVETYGCPSSFPMYDNCSSSGNGFMFMNYMDYTDDACMNMFTNMQTNRMSMAMQSFYPTLLVSNACETPTGIRESIDKFSFSVYPNPTDGIVNLDMYLMEDIGSTVNLSVTNILGKVVKDVSISRPNGKIHQLDLRDQSAGIYFITVSNENFRKSVRLEITK